MVHYPAGGSIRRRVHCSHKGMDMVSNNTRVGCGVWQCSIGTKGPKMYQEMQYSAYLGCNEWLFELWCLSIISNQSAHSPLTSDINKAFLSKQLPLTGYFLFFGPFSVNPRDGCG